MDFNQYPLKHRLRLVLSPKKTDRTQINESIPGTMLNPVSGNAFIDQKHQTRHYFDCECIWKKLHSINALIKQDASFSEWLRSIHKIQRQLNEKDYLVIWLVNEKVVHKLLLQSVTEEYKCGTQPNLHHRSAYEKITKNTYEIRNYFNFA